MIDNMMDIFRALSAFLIAMMLCTIFIRVLQSVAKPLGLVDRPNRRKVHKTHVPLIGGLAIGLTLVISLLVCSWFWFTFNSQHLQILGIALVLLLMGVIDDRIGLKATHRLFIQVICAFQIASSGIRLESLYGVLGIHELGLIQSYVITVVIITGVVNAFNLIDGVDGLAGSLSLVAMVVMAILAGLLQSLPIFIMMVVLSGALIAFLKRNLSSKKIFLGDGGSMFLGFIMVVAGLYLVGLADHNPKVPVGLTIALVFSFLLIPVFDSLRVFWMRFARGISPMSADKTHIHHLLLFFRCSHAKSTIILVAGTLVSILISILLFWQYNLGTAVIFMALLFWTVNWVLASIYWLKVWEQKTKNLEQLN